MTFFLSPTALVHVESLCELFVNCCFPYFRACFPLNAIKGCDLNVASKTGRIFVYVWKIRC